MVAQEAVKLKKGDFIDHQGDIWSIGKTEFYNPGKGSALMKVKIKNVASGKIIDHTFKSNESIEMVEVNGASLQFLYSDGETLFFMSNESFEQYEIPIDVVGDGHEYLKEGREYHVYLSDDKPIDLNLGASVTLEITKAEDVVKGNSTSDITKDATLETGAVIKVPAFIKVGDMVSINPETGEYRGRVNEEK